MSRTRPATNARTARSPRRHRFLCARQIPQEQGERAGRHRNARRPDGIHTAAPARRSPVRRAGCPSPASPNLSELRPGSYNRAYCRLMVAPGPFSGSLCRSYARRRLFFTFDLREASGQVLSRAPWLWCVALPGDRRVLQQPAARLVRAQGVIGRALGPCFRLLRWCGGLAVSASKPARSISLVRRPRASSGRAASETAAARSVAVTRSSVVSSHDRRDPRAACEAGSRLRVRRCSPARMTHGRRRRGRPLCDGEPVPGIEEHSTSFRCLRASWLTAQTEATAYAAPSRPASARRPSFRSPPANCVRSATNSERSTP